MGEGRGGQNLPPLGVGTLWMTLYSWLYCLWCPKNDTIQNRIF